jgi:hypothetical protein
MRVYVLGAGASKHAGYPLADELGGKLADYIGLPTQDLSADDAPAPDTEQSDIQSFVQSFVEGLEERIANSESPSSLTENHEPFSVSNDSEEQCELTQQDIKAICRSSLSRVRDLYGGLGDFESVLTDLMTCGPVAATLGPQIRGKVIEDLKQAVCDFFNDIRTALSPLYDQFAERVQPGDLIITFNYDLGIERALCAAGLWKIENGYGFPIEDVSDGSPVWILKLHGSTNWRAIPYGGASGHFGGYHSVWGNRPVLPFRPDQEYIGCRDFVDPLSASHEVVYDVPALIMPALPKRFYFETHRGKEWKSFWDKLWELARKAVATTDELVIIGYSMPSTDERARELLLEATSKAARLTICCGGGTKQVEEEFRTSGFTNFQTLSEEPTFSDFLQWEGFGAGKS